MTTNEARKDALLARLSLTDLVRQSLAMEANPAPESHDRMVKAWMSDEIERRMGGVQDEDAFCELLDQGHSYTECLIRTFPALEAHR
ncbi:MAG TPA: hypothetical protein VFT75_18545 [Nocardioidaceae bacterium]|nr:hypothetical protein [Nocardioidaceae bacterium]